MILLRSPRPPQVAYNIDFPMLAEPWIYDYYIILHMIFNFQNCTLKFH